MENERLDARLLKIIVGFNIYRSVLFLLSFLFYIVCLVGTIRVINGTLSNQDITLYYVSILVTLFTIPLIIFAPLYAKLLPLIFKKYLLVSNNRIVYITNKKRQEILVKDVVLDYYGSSILSMLMNPIGWSSLQVRFKEDLKNERLLFISITNKQYSQIVNTIQ